MKKGFIIYVIILFSLQGYSQKKFEEGYFINNSDERVNCLIRINWKRTPLSFTYKLTNSSEEDIASVETVKEFGIAGEVKYLRSLVEIDRSSDMIKSLSTDKHPVFEEELLFLKVLIEGKATLYKYFDGKILRYFYNVDTTEFKPLIHNNYAVRGANTIGENNTFRQQLWLDLQCVDFKMSKFEKLRYNEIDLMKVFKEFNDCYILGSIPIKEKTKKDAPSVGIGVGLPYGGVGTRLGANISKHLNLFGAVGLYGYEVGVNVGLRKDFASSRLTQFYLTGMYGTNSAVNLSGPSHVYYEAYTGFTFGMGIKINSRKRGNYWDLGLLVPLRSGKYHEDADKWINDRNTISFEQPWPVLFCFGYNISLGGKKN